MEYDEHFKKHYQEWFRGFKASELIKYEQNLSQFIDSDLSENFILLDEVIVLYELIRDECVYRVSKMAAHSNNLLMLGCPLGEHDCQSQHSGSNTVNCVDVLSVQ